jgi:hypothetical protein
VAPVFQPVDLVEVDDVIKVDDLKIKLILTFKFRLSQPVAMASLLVQTTSDTTVRNQLLLAQCMKKLFD